MAEAIDTGVRTMDDAFEEMLQADTNAEHVNPTFRRNQPLPPISTTEMVPEILRATPMSAL